MTFESDLVEVVGPTQVVTDPERLVGYGTDWTGRWSVAPRAVARPASTAEVSAVLGVCARHGVGVVPQGGNTGLVGGSVPSREGLLVLTTSRLVGLGPVDPVSRQVTAGAGVTVAALRAHVAAAGLDYGVDLASRDSATVGGTLATNAGGVRVVRHGDTRAQVRGIEAVLADGTVVEHLAGLPKDSAGYDLGSLLVGSEGTLAVITAARLRLVPPLPADRVTCLVGVGSVDEALALLDQEGLLAAELMTGAALDLVCRALTLPFPMPSRGPLFLLLETEHAPRLRDGLDVVVDRRLWTYRERLTEAVATLGTVHKLDVAVPVARLGELLDRLPAAVAPYDSYVFGHVAEGNMHVEVVGAPPDDDGPDERVLRLVAELGGTISAEHGVGSAKARWLALSRSAADIAWMRRVKGALDPDGRLNPGVLFT